MLIGIVAGETSGDMLGAGLINALKERLPDARFVGVGGPRMLACGFQSITPMERLSVMGFVEPLGRLPELLRLKRDLVNLYLREQPAVFIGIDSPGFNIRLEQSLHDAGIRTVHYVSPSVWAWGEGRIRKIASAVDLMLALFPFESEIYLKNDIAARCVGHPLADAIDPDVDQDAVREQARKKLGLDPGSATLLCLMPGSRAAEVQRLAPVFLDTAISCLAVRPELHFVIPCANAQRRLQVNQLLASRSAANPKIMNRFTVIDEQSHAAMQAADLVVLASGTATLEALLLRRPMVVCYKLAALTWMLASRMLKVPYVSLPNLLAGRELVPELLQGAVTVDRLQKEIFALLEDHERQQRLASEFAAIHHRIRLDADQQAARAITDMLLEQQV
tara:strand:- start:7029 stop:8201 length:1173 start_codon:yes stop_codon:yes gene_type:complete